MAVKFNQYWDLIPGRKAEYAAFVSGEFLPLMKELGIRVVAGWVVLVGEGPHIISEGLAQDIHHLDSVLSSPTFRSMTTRHMRYVRNYASKVLVPSGRLQATYGEKSPGLVKFNQSWNIRPGLEEAYSEAVSTQLVPILKTLGIEVVAEWSVLIGSGPQMILEGHAGGLEEVGRALEDARYRRLMAQWEDLVEDYRSRILVRHRLFLEAIQEVYGAPLRCISEREISAMYGPLVG